MLERLVCNSRADYKDMPVQHQFSQKIPIFTDQTAATLRAPGGHDIGIYNYYI